jgi:photosystem II stability/assembly factor-like uncharacterized protein
MKGQQLLFYLLAFSGFCILAAIFTNHIDQQAETEKQKQTSLSKSSPEPSEWHYRQRAYPHGQIDKKAYFRAINQKRAFLQHANRSNTASWEYRGPDNIGGRITDVAVHPIDLNTIYAGAASGGLFKSTDRGESWTPILDEALSLSVGDLDVALTNPDILFVGTGEANAGGGSLTYDGAGIYKSADGGASWEHCGLENSGSIGRLVIDPKNENRVFVAAMGALFANNGERGIYRTENGGQSWEQVLYVTDSTGGVDLAIHPHHTDTIYAATWERIRRPGYRQYGGATSGIYRSYDGGDSWEAINDGLPTYGVGRIGISLCHDQPERMYAVVIDSTGDLIDVYKSSNGGDHWEIAGNSGANTPGFMWWFGRVWAHPQDPDIAYLASLDLYQTDNQGSFWTDISSGVHVDQHALYIDPNTPEYMVLGNDGGLYLSEDGGQSWSHKNSLPITQFYTCEIDYSQPDRLYGGTQDNGTVRVINGQVDGWKKIWGGDGFVAQVDPLDNTYVYVESQYGNFRRSVNGGVGFFYAVTGLGSGRNWNTPYMLDPQNPEILYLGGREIYKTVNRAVSWQAISPQLVSAPGDNNLLYGTFTSISVSALDSDIIYGGTDNGRLWLTTDGGASWTEITGQLPDRWLTRVLASPHEEATAFVTFSGYQHNDEQPHVLKTTDFGNSWTDISTNLPPIPTNCIIQDPDNEHHLYLANDAGVYVSYTGGYHWTPLGMGLPNVIVSDLDYHPPTQTLVAATYGRSMYSLELPPTSIVNTSFSGRVMREHGDGISNVEVSNQIQLPYTTTTGTDGSYTFEEFFSSQDYELLPRRDGDDLNGISTFDLVLISQHILGVQTLNSPYKILAADINLSQSVTTLDLIGLRRLILGWDTGLTQTDSWRFIPASHTFSNPVNPWQDAIPLAITVSGLPAPGLTEQDFIGIKMGDVNLDATP